ncbi:MAG: metallophosphoesterase [Leptospiraceae bacterium]|nr:metallophosphoesterase [Leptospiraceae bacterium]
MMETNGRHRTIFIGDVHGCLHELRQMIDRLRPTAEDRVIMLGDLINRGPDPVGVVRYVVERDYECLMGNHEREYLLENDRLDKYRQLRQELGAELHSWIENRPYYIEETDFIAVHAGLHPERSLAESDPEVLTNIRFWDGKGERLNNPDDPPWYDLYTGERPVFYGHWARRGLNLREKTFGLDSGCVYGRRLSAYVLETDELIQIPAARVYYVPPSLRGVRTAT